MSNTAILYVDDEQHNLKIFESSFRRDFTIFTAPSAKAGLSLLEQHPIHIVITDQRMPDMTGIQFLEVIKEKHPHAIRMILSGYTDLDAMMDAINTNRVYRYITKPWNKIELKIILDNAEKFFRLEEQNRQLLQKLQGELNEQRQIIDLLKGYIPPYLIDIYVHAKDKELDAALHAETRIIALLIAEVCQFPALLQTLSPQMVIDFINEFIMLMSSCIQNYGGSINRYFGSGFLVAFGAPISAIDNPLNAVRCAREMNKLMAKLHSRHFFRPTMALGMHSGEVVVGPVASGERLDYAILGQTVEECFKIGSLAHQHPGSIVLSEHTYTSVKDSIAEWPKELVQMNEAELVCLNLKELTAQS